MARVIGCEDVPSSLRTALHSVLRPCDEAVVLPSASRSVQTGAFKNVVFRLDGSERELSSSIFCANMFCGVSALEVPRDVAERALATAESRTRVLRKLRDVVKSENADSNIQCGPSLECDESDRDVAPWQAGFDSASGSCVGLYSATTPYTPDVQNEGMQRAHQVFYIVCKAGAGVAGQTFYSRLVACLERGHSLDEALDSDGAGGPGPQAMRRVGQAAARNRHRILLIAAQCLGFDTINTIGDVASSTARRPVMSAIPTVDVSYNCLTRVSSNTSRSFWQYTAGCCDASQQQGLMSASNVASGFLLFQSADGAARVTVQNEAHSCVPFVTTRLKTAHGMIDVAQAAHRAAEEASARQQQQQYAHSDHEFVSSHFAWSNRKFTDQDVDIEPEPLWGSHRAENWLATWGLHLGMAALRVLRLHPELVCLNGFEGSKLRVAQRALRR